MITVAGEALIDVIVERSGAVTAHPGGAPFNVARAVARLGGECQFLGRTGDDSFGARLRGALLEHGVQLALPEPSPRPTTLAVAKIDAEGVADYRFYLEGTSAPEVRPEDLPDGALDDTTAMALGGLGVIAQPLSATLLGLLAQAPAAMTVLFDPNCRPRAIGDVDAYRATVHAYLARSDIVKVSTDDLRLLDPGARPRDAARRLLGHHATAVLVTDGPGSVAVHTAELEESVPVPPAEIVDTVGAGDAFVAGFLTWWTDQDRRREDVRDPEALLEATRAGVAVAGAVVTVAGADLPAGFRWAAAGGGATATDAVS